MPTFATIATIAAWEVDPWWDWRTGTNRNHHGWSDDSDHIITVNDQDLSLTERAVARAILQEVDDACGLTFTQTTGTANITITNDPVTYLAETAVTWSSGGAIISATIAVDPSMGGGPGHEKYDFVWYHEFLEALGIGHSGQYYVPTSEGILFTNDNTDWSSGSGSEGVVTDFDYLRRVDIYALRQLYGPDIDTAVPTTPTVSSNWTLVADADFDGDGDQDFLWRHSNGANTIWEMQNGSYVVNHNLPTASSSWHVEGTPDIDDDGDADILWRHQDGQNVAWELGGLAYVVNHNDWLQL